MSDSLWDKRSGAFVTGRPISGSIVAPLQLMADADQFGKRAWAIGH